MRYFILLYNSLLWGLLVAVMTTNSLWLDMRIKVGLIIPAVVLISMSVALFVQIRLIRTPRFALLNLILCFIVTYLVLGAKRLVVLPASIIRETINMTGISFSVINWGLIIFLILGLIIIWICRPKHN